LAFCQTDNLGEGETLGRLRRNLKRAITQTSESGLSLELRLVARFLVFLVTIMLCISIILVSAGVFKAGLRENIALIERELSHLSQDIYTDFGNFSLSSVSIAGQLSKSVEATLTENGVEPSELAQHPELLETILSREFSKLLTGLQRSKSSGIFLILNATANPYIDGAENSRAGLLLKNMEAGAINPIYYDIRYMRGPASIGRNNEMTLLPQWKMEFDVTNADYFSVPIETALESDLPLSRLYHWCPRAEFEDSDSAMLCSVPLIASDGTIMGVAGFEVTSMLFKSNYSPDNSSQNRIFCMFAPYSNQCLCMEKAMFAGSYFASDIIPSANAQILDSTDRLQRYVCTSNSYYGLDNKVRLYAADSPYEQEEWRIVLLVPEADIDAQVARENRSIIALLALLTAGCIVLSIHISRKYIYPVREAFEAIKSQKAAEHGKTWIPEIDDLLEFLAKQDEETERPSIDSSAHGTGMFEKFVENISTLSVAEKAVFDLYMEGHTAKEIADILCLSINTIKTHNKRIYIKLNVSSRKELLVYAGMMQEIGQGNSNGKTLG
jgi:DNA-binding CsgD family transcriptional regulator